MFCELSLNMIVLAYALLAMVLRLRLRELGQADALFNLGQLYFDGILLAKDVQRAIGYFEQAPRRAVRPCPRYGVNQCVARRVVDGGQRLVLFCPRMAVTWQIGSRHPELQFEWYWQWLGPASCCGANPAYELLQQHISHYYN